MNVVEKVPMSSLEVMYKINRGCPHHRATAVEPVHKTRCL